MTNAKTNKANKPSAKSNAGKRNAVEQGANVNQTQAEQDAALAEIKAKEEAEAQAKAKAEEETKAKLEAEEQAKAELEAKAQQEAEAKAKAEEAAKAKLEAEEQAKAKTMRICVLGVFAVRAKSDAGFWRSGKRFTRQEEKLVIVVSECPGADSLERVSVKGYESEHVMFIDADRAKRIYHEPNLTVKDVDLETIIDPDSATTLYDPMKL